MPSEIKRPFFYLISLFGIIALMGCRSSAKQKTSSQGESQADVEAALESVAGALAGRSLSEEEKRRLLEQLRRDEEARSALESISQSEALRPIGPGADAQGRVRYCPVDGERYAPHMRVCPVHHRELNEVSE